MQEFHPPPPDMVPDYNAGPCHVFTATEQIVNLPQMQGRAFTQPVHLPKQLIDELFTSSLQLNLDNEVTPVQIWSKLSNLSTQFPLGAGILEALRGELTKYVRCNR
jgi:hypothetical protein